MQIKKTTKSVTASTKITTQLKKQIFEELEALGGYFNYDREVDELMSDYSLSREDAESIVWEFTTQNDIECCGEVKASTKISAKKQAQKHIKAAIDALATCGKDDIVAKDNIANLSVVMFDLIGED